MASIPLKNMTTIYNRASENTPDTVRMVNYSAELDYPNFRLWHYGTLILTLDIERGIEFLGGFSASDRDAINSILVLAGMTSRVSITGGYMHVL